jgi:Flp pilus assembly protein TadG
MIKPNYPIRSARVLRRIIRNRRGVAALEFALIAPVMMMFILGMSDQLYNLYASSVLEGAVQKAARDQTLQAYNTTTGNALLDARVLQLIRGMAPTATATSTRRSYPNFSNVATPEPFVDTNHDGDRDTGECYTDTNNNGLWDVDPGINGDGSASDAVLYTMTVTYPRSFPAYKLLGGNPDMSIKASTIMKNQPWSDQSIPATPTRCT